MTSPHMSVLKQKNRICKSRTGKFQVRIAFVNNFNDILTFDNEAVVLESSTRKGLQSMIDSLITDLDINKDVVLESDFEPDPDEVIRDYNKPDYSEENWIDELEEDFPEDTCDVLDFMNKRK